MRQAAGASNGAISNTRWGDFEAGIAVLSPRIQQGIAAAFGWPSDWPFEEVVVEEGFVAETRARFDTLEARVAELERRLAVSDQAGARVARDPAVEVGRKDVELVPLRSAADAGGERPSKSTGRRTNRPTGVPADDGGHVDG